MSTRLVTVTWAITVPIEVSDDATVGSVTDLGLYVAKGAAAVRAAYEQLQRKDGEITDLQDP